MDVIFVQSEKDDEVVVYSNEKDSKSYQFKWNLTYDDFYGLLLDAIMRKNLIESFEVRKNGFRLELL